MAIFILYEPSGRGEYSGLQTMVQNVPSLECQEEQQAILVSAGIG